MIRLLLLSILLAVASAASVASVASAEQVAFLPPGVYSFNDENALENPTLINLNGRVFVTGVVSKKFGNPSHKKSFGGMRRYILAGTVTSIQQLDAPADD